MLAEFIDAYEECTDRAGLQGLDKIKGIIKYLECEDRELWAGLPEAQMSDYDAFMKEIKVMYPDGMGKGDMHPRTYKRSHANTRKSQCSQARS
jgi:hypothetical protein